MHPDHVAVGGVKQCQRCDAIKPLVDFARHARDGHQPWCRACQTEARREYRARLKQDDPQKYREQCRRDAARKRKPRPAVVTSVTPQAA